MRNRAEAEARGRRGERLAIWYLRLKGWRILATRARIAGGEVDIIARRAGTLAFIEVKWRDNVAARDHSINAARLARVARAAERLASRHARPGDTLRIDAILLAPGQWPRHLTNVMIAGMKG